MTLMKNLSENMKAIRGIQSQVEFAKELGIAKSTLQAIEKQRSAVRLDTLEVISEQLGVSVAELLAEREEGSRWDWAAQIRISRKARSRSGAWAK